jgi:hypothetical protein
MKEKVGVQLVFLEEVERLLLLVTKHPTSDDLEEVVLVHLLLLVYLLLPTINQSINQSINNERCCLLNVREGKRI